MKIAEHIKRKTGATYWTYTAQTDEEAKYLATFETLKESKWGNTTTWYSGDARTHELITAWNKHNDNTEEGEDMSKTEANEMTMQDLRKLAADKAKSEGRPTTDLRTRWSKDQLAEYIANGTWPEVNSAGPAAPDAAALGAMMAQMIAQFMPPQGIDEDAVRAIVAEQIGTAKRRFEIVMPNKEVKEAGVQHEKFPTLCKIIAAREHFMLVGPAGSGKTHANHAAAEAMNLKFYCISVGQQTTKTDLLGFIDANGNYHRTQLRDAVEYGGLFLLDEADAGNANTLTVLNAILANGVAAFPDGMVKVHEDFVCACAMNTFGRGADRQYVGRNQLDAASLDRFAVVEFDYDEALERLLTGNDEWCKAVQSYRKAAFDLKERVVISPRASYKGAKLLQAGFTWDEVEEMVIWKGINSDIKNKIVNNAPRSFRKAA